MMRMDIRSMMLMLPWPGTVTWSMHDKTLPVTHNGRHHEKYPL
eukprot:COSAG02_NODE_356_length_23978_cov_7.868504_12_plen_43_part_00